MSKIEKEIKSYFEDVLKHDDQYESIVKKANFQKREKKEKKEIFNFMKMKNILKFALPCLVVVAIAVVSIVLLTGNKNPNVEKETSAVVQLNVNPSISFVVSDDGKVLSVYGENDEGKMIISGEVFIDLSIEDAIEKVIELENQTGYLVSGNVSAEENKITVTIEGDSEELLNQLNDKVNTAVQSICDELNIQENLEIAKTKAKENLVNRALKLDPTLTQEKAESMSSEDLVKYISACQIEKVSIPTEELEELYNSFKLQEIKLLEKEETKAVINTLDATYLNIKNSYNQMYNALVEAQKALNDTYVEWFIKEESAYQKALKGYHEAKTKVIVLENEISKMDDSDLMKNFKEIELAASKQALVICEQALDTAKAAAESIVNGLNAAIETALENMEEFYNNLPEEIKTKVTESLSNLETKINDIKDKAFDEFETKYKDEIENAIASLENQKQALIDSLKEQPE